MGQYKPDTKVISIDIRYSSDLRMLFRDPGTMLGTERGSRAWSTLVHEFTHSTHSIPMDWYTTNGYLEEGLTQSVTRLIEGPLAQRMWGQSPMAIRTVYPTEQSIVRTLGQIANRSPYLSQARLQNTYMDWVIANRRDLLWKMAKDMSHGYLAPLAEAHPLVYEQQSRNFAESIVKHLRRIHKRGNASEILWDVHDMDKILNKYNLEGWEDEIAAMLGDTRELMATKQLGALEDLSELFIKSHGASPAEIRQAIDKANNKIQEMELEADRFIALAYLEGLHTLLVASEE